MPRSSAFLLALGVFYAFGGLPPAAPLVGQEACQGGRIGEVSIETHSIFDEEGLPDESRLLWVYRVANAVHIPTRAEFIERNLLFEEGDCYDPSELLESERILREYRFIARAEVSEEVDAEGNRQVRVTTRDEWTTKISLHVRFEGGIRFDGASVVEENLLGRGVTFGAFLVDREEHREAGLALEVPSIGHRNVDGLLRIGRTRAGESVRQAFVHPFHGERPGVALRQGVEYRRDLFSYVLGDASAYSHLLVPFEAQRMELSGARRFGVPGALFTVGGGVSFERVDVRGEGRVEGVRGGDFSVREPVPSASALLRPLASQVQPRQAVRVNLLLGMRRLRFAPRSGLDALTGVQDVPVGQEVTFGVGRSLGYTGPGREGDFFARLGVLVGWGNQGRIGQITGRIEGRREDGGSGHAGHRRDVLAETRGIVYLQPPGPLDQTVVIRGSLQGGWRTTAPFQVTLGGEDGVRGYAESDFPGGQRALLSVESRIRMGGPLSHLVDLGVTVFGDVGAVWAADAPYGLDSGARGTLGAGLRLGFPAGTSSVIRADLAFPVGPGASGRGPVFRISAVEHIGISLRSAGSQVHRSRRSGIDGDYIGVGREGSGS
jgi:hypothetical protein